MPKNLGIARFLQCWAACLDGSRARCAIWTRPDEGMPFDGSSIEGFQAINESDMKLVPDIETAFVDPFGYEYSA